MKISGFTFVKDAVKFAFPVTESIRSVLPLCDEMIVNIGLPDTDETEKLIRKTVKSPKLRIIRTEWDPEFRVRQRIFAQQTNIALNHCKGDWCFYIQADEAVHEEDHEALYNSMKGNLDDERVEGLLFDFIHFFGSYETCVNSYHWYRKEVRIIRNHIGVTSFKDAQGFRLDGRKLRVRESGGRIFHYGWVRPPGVMLAKKKAQDRLHHKSIDEAKYAAYFEFVDQIDPFMIAPYRGAHPALMKKKIMDWKYKFDKKRSRHRTSFRDWRYRFSDVLARLTGIRPGEYRNYRILK